ncbi:MAG TPA: CinA family protein [Jatrophihabitantaceae bacterium]|jgi:nicotinamide-nucleotide amidase|nr:CinA family protein [Jatrophihabitantaceae bacterium]
MSSTGLAAGRAAVGDVVAEIHRVLAGSGATVAVAESLTGGLIAAALTEPAGASATVRGGLVVYATDLKSSLAGVPPDLLAERGAVDPEVALALARGARERLDATYGIGVTGVAGPDLQDGQPVGTVFGAVAGPQDAAVRGWTLPGGRSEIRAGAVEQCLRLLLEECQGAD